MWKYMKNCKIQAGKKEGDNKENNNYGMYNSYRSFYGNTEVSYWSKLVNLEKKNKL